MAKELVFKKESNGEVYEVYNKKKDFLGHICIEEGWKLWCFYPEEATFFSISCLQEIIDFLNKLTALETKEKGK